MGADRVDRLFVGRQILQRIGSRRRAFAQHVERKAITARFPIARIGERLMDRPTGDELLAEQSHREIDAFSDQWLAAFAQHRREGLLERALRPRVDQLAGDQQPPGGGVDEERRAASEMRLPIAGADLVANQAVTRGNVGNPQQRLGEAHQRDAFAAVEGKLEHQRIDAT